MDFPGRARHIVSRFELPLFVLCIGDPVSQVSFLDEHGEPPKWHQGFNNDTLPPKPTFAELRAWGWWCCREDAWGGTIAAQLPGLDALPEVFNSRPIGFRDYGLGAPYALGKFGYGIGLWLVLVLNDYGSLMGLLPATCEDTDSSSFHPCFLKAQWALVRSLWRSSYDDKIPKVSSNGCLVIIRQRHWTHCKAAVSV